MTAPDGIVSADHLDLLVTAARRYRLLEIPGPAAALAAPSLTTAVAAEALCEGQFAVLRWQADRGHPLIAVPAELRPYRYRPVADVLGPIEVIKACHAYQHLASTHPEWAESLACLLIEAILLAATRHIPGYAAAPWRWTRPRPRPAPPIGLRRTWRPPLNAVTWVSPADLTRQWSAASHVVLTLEALPDVPGGLRAGSARRIRTAGEARELSASQGQP